MSIQAKAAEIEWRRFYDEDTYYPLRDDARALKEHGRRRQYAVRWCVEAQQAQRALTDGEIAIAGHCKDLFDKIEKARGQNATRFEFSDRRSWPEAKHTRFRKVSGEIAELAGFEAVARQIPNGHRCFHAIIEGDSFAGLQQRCGVNWRGALDLMQVTLRALELYHGFNDLDAARSNTRGQAMAR